MELKLTQKILDSESQPGHSRKEIDDYYASVVDELLEWFQKASGSGASSVYSALQNRVDVLRDDLRESVQALTRRQMQKIILRLKSGDPIDDDDLRLIRLWLIGDAEAYVEEENNFDDWVSEIRRLEGEIRRLREGPVTTDRIKALQAVLTDARGVIPNIANFLIDRERVSQYEETMSRGLEESGRETLAAVLEASYDSPRR